MWLRHGLLIDVIFVDTRRGQIGFRTSRPAVETACRTLRSYRQDALLDAACSSVAMIASIWAIRLRCAGMRRIDKKESIRLRQ